MPQYFFHVMDGQAIIDTVGLDLTSMDEVKTEAIRTAGQILKERVSTWSGETWRMSVADDTGKVVYAVQFSASDKSGD